MKITWDVAPWLFGLVAWTWNLAEGRWPYWIALPLVVVCLVMSLITTRQSSGPDLLAKEPS